MRLRVRLIVCVAGVGGRVYPLKLPVVITRNKANARGMHAQTDRRRGEYVLAAVR